MLAGISLAVLLLPSLPARAQQESAQAPDSADASGRAADLEELEGKRRDAQSRLDELEQQIEVLAEEIADLQTSEAVPAELDPTKGVWGLGPSASKVYKRDQGLAIGGYGDLRFRHKVGESDGDGSIYDALRFVLYTGYKWSDWLVMNSEVEFEHADTGSNGEVAVEFLTVDFMLRPELNLRTGLVLIPMGFINEVHEPPFYYGASRPEVARRIIPTTWRENGVGVFGEYDLGDGGLLAYRMYGVNGFDARGFSSSGLRGGRQSGSEALAQHWAFVGRLDWDMSGFAPGLLVGGSVYTGYSGQNQSETVCVDFCSTDPGDPVFEPVTVSNRVPNTLTTIYEVHGQYKAYGLTARGLLAQAFLDDAGDLSRALGKDPTSSVAKQMVGGYAEVGYDVLPLFLEDTRQSLEPFFRYEYLNTQQEVPSGFVADDSKKFDVYVAGLGYKPIPQVAIKFDYRSFQGDQGEMPDEFEASIGFVF